MWYHPIKSGCKKINNSADMVETVIFDHMSPKCDFDLEDSKPVFLNVTLAHDDASPYKVWLQKIQQLRRYRPVHGNFEPFLWQSNPNFLQDNPAYDDVPSNQV